MGTAAVTLLGQQPEKWFVALGGAAVLCVNLWTQNMDILFADIANFKVRATEVATTAQHQQQKLLCWGVVRLPYR